MSRIWIVRHGNTFAPDEPPRRIGARTDLPLVESGQEQAAALAVWFAQQGVRFDRVLSSPLLRTTETARIIAGDAPIEPADFLAEIDHGPDEDSPEPAVIARIGAAALAAWDAQATPPPGWIVGAARRHAGWRALLDDASGTILAVTSNGAARFALTAEAGLAAQAAALPHRRLRTGAAALLVREADAGWRIAAWDRRP